MCNLLGPCVVSGRHRASLTLCASGRSLGYSLGVTARAHSSLAVPVHDPSRSSRLSGRSMDSRPALLARVPACSLAYPLASRLGALASRALVGKGRISRPCPVGMRLLAHAHQLAVLVHFRRWLATRCHVMAKGRCHNPVGPRTAVHLGRRAYLPPRGPLSRRLLHLQNGPSPHSPRHVHVCPHFVRHA